MGFLGIGDKPPKQKPSAQEIAEAEFAAYRQGLSSKHGNPLRKEQIAEARDPFKEAQENNFFSARASADVAKAEADSNAQVREMAAQSGRGLKNMSGTMAERGNTLAEARTDALQGAKQSAYSRADERRLNAQRTGEELGQVTQQSLSSQASSANSLATAKLQSQMDKDTSKAQMWGDLIMAAGTYGKLKYDANKAQQKQDQQAQADMVQENGPSGVQQDMGDGTWRDVGSPRKNMYGLRG